MRTSGRPSADIARQRRSNDRSRTAPGPRQTRGFTLVELMVATVVGLAIVAAAIAFVTQHVREQRAMRVAARLTQDLRNAADIVARDLRRAGWWGAAASGVHDDSGATPLANPYAPTAADFATPGLVRFRYSRDAGENGSVDGNEQFGFRLRSGALELQLGDGGWQAVTDAGSLVVTAFTLTPRIDEASLADFCARPCAPGNATCPPRQQVVHVEVGIAGRSAVDPDVTRSLQASARLRNAGVVGACEP